MFTNLVFAVLQASELPPLRVPAAKRLVAVGDLHGDLDKVQMDRRLPPVSKAADAVDHVSRLSSRMLRWRTTHQSNPVSWHGVDIRP